MQKAFMKIALTLVALVSMFMASASVWAFIRPSLGFPGTYLALLSVCCFVLWGAFKYYSFWLERSGQKISDKSFMFRINRPIALIGIIFLIPFVVFMYKVHINQNTLTDKTIMLIQQNDPDCAEYEIRYNSRQNMDVICANSSKRFSSVEGWGICDVSSFYAEQPGNVLAYLADDGNFWQRCSLKISSFD